MFLYSNGKSNFMHRSLIRLSGAFALLLAMAHGSMAQDKSVNPGINDAFANPDVKSFQEKFEVESREIFTKRQEILAACGIQAGHTVADIGAGTGLFTRLFAKAVGNGGQVIAVDIAPNFLEHIAKTNRELDIRNVNTLLCKSESTELPDNSVDLAFICDTYHHFEFPRKTMASLYRAIKPGGRIVVIDFKRIDGESSDWVMKHVRAGQEVFEAEITDCGFVKLRDVPGVVKENYMMVFQKPSR
ncbi:MAG: class I SAM-dependent methyltransferase [Planctomycetota bacterium]|jgi:ubiquinone/menaquinone biosynthesis C-methylase UbiE